MPEGNQKLILRVAFNGSIQRQFFMIVLLILLIGFPIRQSHALQFRCVFGSPEQSGWCGDSVQHLYAFGEIRVGDSEKWKTLFSQSKRRFPEVIIESDGGDVDEAIKIGHLFRQNEISVTVAGRCASSCLFLLLGGVERGVSPNGVGVVGYASGVVGKIKLGQILVHRPYRAQVHINESRDVTRASRDLTKAKIRRYLEDMDIAGELASVIDSTPPEGARQLTLRELKLYRIIGTDPTHEERQISRLAAQYRLTSAEYRQRSLEAESYCVQFGFERISCEDALLKGESFRPSGRNTFQKSVPSRQ
jgi:hypothetical protein